MSVQGCLLSSLGFVRGCYFFRSVLDWLCDESLEIISRSDVLQRLWFDYVLNDLRAKSELKLRFRSCLGRRYYTIGAPPYNMFSEVVVSRRLGRLEAFELYSLITGCFCCWIWVGLPLKSKGDPDLYDKLLSLNSRSCEIVASAMLLPAT